ncbi:MAG TPA: hypothetical protein PK054_12920, partial [Anaerohalosphaeraceae bacterium]|nr:hypothetical protein [Anaerohalosphaeraceae bacterium]HPP57469.1 hypothetical protein [Anaerohalosphaeraceae bacterium]
MSKQPLWAPALLFLRQKEFSCGLLDFHSKGLLTGIVSVRTEDDKVLKREAMVDRTPAVHILLWSY